MDLCLPVETGIPSSSTILVSLPTRDSPKPGSDPELPLPDDPYNTDSRYANPGLCTIGKPQYDSICLHLCSLSFRSLVTSESDDFACNILLSTSSIEFPCATRNAPKSVDRFFLSLSHF